MAFSLVNLPFQSLVGLFLVTIASALFGRIVYNLYWHPLAKFPGPWYAASFSLSAALISVWRVEPQWLQSLIRKYGTSTPIRIQPQLLLFPMASALDEIYWDKKCNLKSPLYGTGALGPPHLFSTLDGEEHRKLRSALGGNQWAIGSLKKSWEPRIDELIDEFAEQMTGLAAKKEKVVLSDWLAWFAADIMSMLSFGEKFGFIRDGADHLEILTSWRKGLDYFGFVGRFKFFRQYILNTPVIGDLFMPKVSDETGMGWLMHQADRKVTERETQLQEGPYKGQMDLMQYCLDARIKGEPLNPMQKRAHCTLLIQAGADTTGTGLGSTMRYLLTNPSIMKRVREEIEAADSAGKLSKRVQYDEAIEHLPLFVASIKESLRLQPPADNLFGRVAPKEGKIIQGFYIPPGAEITSNAYIVQRDPALYDEPETFNPDRWLESKDKARRYDSASFVFGVGPRICLGKEIAMLEMCKLLPEFVRRFDFKLLSEGAYVVAGGVAYNRNFAVELSVR